MWNSVDNRQRKLKDVKDKIDAREFDVAFPILADKTAEKYRSVQKV